MEDLMPPIQVAHAGDNCLRFVFDDAVVLFSLAADATFADVARILDEPARQRLGNPVAIDVTFAIPPRRFDSQNPISTKPEDEARRARQIRVLRLQQSGHCDGRFPIPVGIRRPRDE